MTNWNEQDHPRDPKGKSTGGQFVSGKQAAAWQRIGKFEYKAMQSEEWAETALDGEEMFEDPRQIVEDENMESFSGFARQFFSEALWDDESKPATLIVDETGQVAAFYQGAVDITGAEFILDDDRPVYWLHYIGASDHGKGYGAVAFADALKDYARQAYDFDAEFFVLTSASASSSRFYDAIGMHRKSFGASDYYYLDLEEVEAILEVLESK